ncbi:MAG TPA: peptide chain release factor N(5)-glutamine methyltransferase [Pyrinomonadaceae bacterium]|jgi:release factor glutamine methyltransferase|nr:peptide chain release factor N(5)-glutamine methyltransferase [Pyrinomonadaceae bacterium]
MMAKEDDLPVVRVAEATGEAAERLRQAGVGEARREALSLLADVISRDQTFLLTHPEHAIAPAALKRFRAVVERRAKGEPQQYIRGRQEFFGLEFEVTPAVLIPRPETELLVETALELLDATKGVLPALVCDVGTGSGCIAVTILHEEARARATGLDISHAALRVAARNASRHGVAARLDLVAADCFAALDAARARFSLIVSNPPYVAEEALVGLQREVRCFEPRVALTPGGDGLRIIRKLLTQAPRLLLPGGHLLMEIGFDQGAAVERLIDRRAWQLLDIHKDLQGIPRTVALRKT